MAQRLGHPNSQILKLLLQNNCLSCNNSANFVNSCIHYLHGKMHRLPFPSSRFVANSPFELVHTDLWGPVPLNSINGYNIMSFLLIISLVSHGCTYFLLNLKFTPNLSCFMLWLKHSSQLILKLLDQMVGVNTPLNPLNPSSLPMGLIIKSLVPILLNKMA